ncbi:MAG: hypothetical protein ACPGYT_03250 [Nitrospirales bacterium]
MTTIMPRIIVGISLSILLFAVNSFSAESADVGKFVKARIEIGEMMTNYFSSGKGYGGGGRPSPEKMKEMGADINSKLSTLLSKHGLTLEEYRQHSADVFGNDTAVKSYLSQHPDLKKRYEALPFDRMSRGGGRSGRGY